MPIFKSVEKFKKEYSNLINGFSVIDENDPITSLQLSSLTEILDKWTNKLNESFLKHAVYLADFDKKNNSLLVHYEQNIKALNDSLNRNIKNLTKSHIDACQKLKQKIEAARKDSNYSIEQLEVEFNYFLATSEQNRIILENDFEEAKRRFDYHKEEAKESYLEVVKKNNEILDLIKENLYASYEAERKTLLLEQQEELDKLKNYVAIQEKELFAITNALELEKSNMKEKYRQESASLNENIKKIADEKNKLIDKARSQYTKSMNEASIERENKKTVYQAKSQALLKEFVTKINIIDESTSKIKKEFEKKTNAIKREYYTDIFNKTKTFHNQLEQIYASSTTAKLDKYTHHLLRFRNKQHQVRINALKKEKELILLELTKDHTIKLLSNRNDKNFLEIDKNFDIKNINDQEQFDNKYYQETDNIFENNFNYTVKTANYRFAQQANLLRCQSQIRTKLLERNYDGISANYYKKIETIQSKINALKLNIEILERSHAVSLTYLDESFKNHLHLEETNNLLEIEKNKLLKEYNASQYDYNVKNIALSKDYGYKKLELENQKALEYKNLKASLENLLLEKNNVSTAFAIKREELNEKFSKIKTQVINNNDLKLTKENYISSLQKNDIKYAGQLIQSYLSFIDSFKKTVFEIIDVILKDITPTADNFNYLESLLNSFFVLFAQILKEILHIAQEELFEVLDHKMEYIYNFKYKSSLDALEDSHNAQQIEIKEKKSEILDKMDSSNKTIENFRQKIYTLINDNEMLIHANQLRKKKLDPSTHLSVKQTELKIKDYKEKIDNFNRMNHLHNADLVELNHSLVIKNEIHKRELQKIRKMIHDDIKVYKNYKENLNIFFQNVSDRITIFKDTQLIHSTSSKKFLTNVERTVKKLTHLLSYVNMRLSISYDTFLKEIEVEMAYRMQCCSNEFKYEIKRYNRQYNKAIHEYQTEYQDTISNYESEISKQNLLIEETMKEYDKKLDLENLKFQTNSGNSDLLYHATTEAFFTSYYAIVDNHQKILQYHNKLNTDKQEKFRVDKLDLENEQITQQDILNYKLKVFLQTKNEEIEHLPIAFKFNSKILNRETKKKNVQLHEDMKEAKNQFNLQKKRIEKNISGLRAHLSQDKFANEYNQKKNIILEQKHHLNTLRQSLKEIEIQL